MHFTCFNQVASNELLSTMSLLLALLTLLEKVNSFFLYLKTHVLSLSNIPDLYHMETRWFHKDSWVEVALRCDLLNAGSWCSNELSWSISQFHLANYFQGASQITFLWCSHFAQILLKWPKWRVCTVAAHFMISHTNYCHS